MALVIGYGATVVSFLDRGTLPKSLVLLSEVPKLLECSGSGGYRKGGSLCFESDHKWIMKLRISGGDVTGTESLGVQWYALNTKANYEELVARQIERIGIECFLPLLEEQRIIRYQSKLVKAPLFPGYLFTRANLMEHYRVLAYTRGVRKIVTFGSSPAVVDSMIIDAIKDKMSHVKACSIEQSREAESGQLVRITGGPLAGLDAVFMRKMSGGQRAMLLLRTLAVQSRAVIDIDQITPCVAV